ncbi:heparinase [Sphingomonas sp. Leaf407]|uniref:heparinase II/III family protein n=1 Tax=unclassified Sphingomonas TaxID=196159 RepID=UPI0006F37ECF|nr:MULTISPECIES: heparinase II/III family protein [unclassified Sphingomonas]KQN39523.1 heparinase [Sphingomonas sp. Leaf42]KQT28800.1 heparinase [Sphingomonas sp. Leaf407]
MTEPPPIDEPRDGIDVGKRLVRQGGGTGLSLSERVRDKLQRLAWRTPLHGLRLKGRHPLKLIAVADDPFLGDLDRGAALLAGKLMVRGEALPLDRLELARPKFSAAFAEHLHGFAWLRDLSSVAPRVTAVPIAETIMLQWLADHGERITEPAWNAATCGRRMLSWIAHAPLILSSTDLLYRSQVLHAFARTARHLDGEAGKAPAGIAAIVAWTGVVAAGLVIPGGDARRAFGETGLIRALTTSVFETGGLVGRSPADQLDAVMTLAALREIYAARRMTMPEPVAAHLTIMVSALLGVCHGDGGLSCWQGAGPVPGERIADVVAATGVRTRPLRHAGDWGYQRLAAGRTIAIVDAAPPPVARAAHEGCASTLAFELSDGGQRIVVNCGGANIAALTLSADLRRALRSTAAHSTLVLSDTNSTAIQPDGSLGKGVGVVDMARQESDAISRIEGSHDGYAKRLGFQHRRVLTLSADGRDVQGEDMLIPTGRRARRGDTPFVVRFHLAPGIAIEAGPDDQTAFLRLPSGPVWQFRAKGALLSVEESLWIGPDGLPVETFQLVLAGTTPPGGHDLSWRFHKTR